MTVEEKAYLQEVVDDSYFQFTNDILANRDISKENLQMVANGRIMTGKQALAVGLIDTIGGLFSAQEYLAKITGLDKEPIFREVLDRKNWFEKITAKVGFSHDPIPDDVKKLLLSAVS